MTSSDAQNPQPATQVPPTESVASTTRTAEQDARIRAQISEMWDQVVGMSNTVDNMSASLDQLHNETARIRELTTLVNARNAEKPIPPPTDNAWLETEPSRKSRKLVRSLIVLALAIALLALLTACGQHDTINGCTKALQAQWATNMANNPTDQQMDAQTQDTFPACDGLTTKQFNQANNNVIAQILGGDTP